MAKKQGKIKAIPVKEVIEEMQVLFTDSRGTFVLKVKQDNIKYDTYDVAISYVKNNLEKFKILVVEYKEKIPQSINGEINSDFYPPYNTHIINQIPLKYSQWQSAIDNGEVDSDKVVEFEIVKRENCNCGIQYWDLNTIGCIGGMDCKAFDASYARVIPQKKRIYTRDEVEKLIMKYALDQHSIVCSPELGNWIKENLK